MYTVFIHTRTQGVPSPAPPTPLLPASPATSGVGSPAQQPSITPEENEVYMRKLAELQKYIPLLQKWISKLTKEDRNNQLPKLKQLYSLLSSSNKRFKMWLSAVYPHINEPSRFVCTILD